MGFAEIVACILAVTALAEVVACILAVAVAALAAGLVVDPG